MILSYMGELRVKQLRSSEQLVFSRLEIAIEFLKVPV